MYLEMKLCLQLDKTKEEKTQAGEDAKLIFFFFWQSSIS